VFAVTSKGALCSIASASRMLDRWVFLKTDTCYAISATEKLIACAGADGVVRIFEPLNLEYVTTLPKPHGLGKEYLGKDSITHLPTQKQEGETFPDAIAARVFGDNSMITIVYSDHSLFVWDVRQLNKIGKYRSFLSHAGCIWDVETVPEKPASERPLLPSNTFVTCSSDNTIRFWNLDSSSSSPSSSTTPSSTTSSSSSSSSSSSVQRNLYSKDLLRTIFVNPENLKCMKAGDNTQEPHSNSPASDSESGIRCIRVNPTVSEIASGDRQGNVRVHDLHSMNQTVFNEAHEVEVLCLDYSKSTNGGMNFLGNF
jgi:WD40 repeat protein